MSITEQEKQTWERIKYLEARIEVLEAALQTIRLQNVEPYCREIARAALDHTHTGE